jgi:hypothetical protein
MTRSIYQLGLCVSLATLAAACGDDGSTGTGGSGGTGGEGGTPTTTTSSTTSSSSSTTTSEGGGGSGGTGGTGGTTTSMGGGGSGGTGGTGGTGGAGGAGGSGGAGGGTGGAGGMMGPTASEQIAAVKAAADGPVDLMVSGVFVTYLKPTLGMDVAGFFVQAEASGPAIFVAVDPASLMPSPKVGDELEFTATEVTTSSGIKQVTAITAASLISTGNAIDPLVTDVSMADDLVTNLDMYESRAIKISGDINVDFINAGFPQVATPIQTVTLDDPDLRLRMPNTVRDQYDLEAACKVTVDYGVMWRFNTVAQPSVYDGADLMNMTCPAPTVVGAIPTSLTELVVTFSRNLDPATVDATDFMFDNGLMATGVMVNGDTVTVTTNAEVPGTAYTLTVMNLNDVLGAPIGMPNTAMFNSYVPVAQMVFNEMNPNIGGGRDLIELLVTAPGTTNGITVHQKGSADEVLAAFPDVLVQAGDIIVVHLSPIDMVELSETMAKNELSTAGYYATAWDFVGVLAKPLSFSNRVLELDGPGGIHLDAVPFVLSNSGNPPAAFPTALQALQAEGNWLPADCGGMLCTYASTPTAVAISADYLGCGTTATANTISRKPGMITKMKSDWNTAGAHSWGLPNP